MSQRVRSKLITLNIGPEGTVAGSPPASWRTHAARPRRGCGRTRSPPRRRRAAAAPSRSDRGVDATMPVAQPVGDLAAALGAEHRGAQTERGAVGQLDGLLLVADPVIVRVGPNVSSWIARRGLGDVGQHHRLDERRLHRLGAARDRPAAAGDRVVEWRRMMSIWLAIVAGRTGRIGVADLTSRASAVTWRRARRTPPRLTYTRSIPTQVCPPLDIDPTPPRRPRRRGRRPRRRSARPCHRTR